MDIFVTIQEQEESYIPRVIFRRYLYLYGVAGGVDLKGSCSRRAEVLSHCLVLRTKERPGCYLNRNRLGIKCLENCTCYASLVTSLL